MVIGIILKREEDEYMRKLVLLSCISVMFFLTGCAKDISYEKLDYADMTFLDDFVEDAMIQADLSAETKTIPVTGTMSINPAIENHIELSLKDGLFSLYRYDFKIFDKTDNQGNKFYNAFTCGESEKESTLICEYNKGSINSFENGDYPLVKEESFSEIKIQDYVSIISKINTNKLQVLLDELYEEDNSFTIDIYYKNYQEDILIEQSPNQFPKIYYYDKTSEEFTYASSFLLKQENILITVMNNQKSNYEITYIYINVE